MKPSTLSSNMCILYEEMGQINHTTACPVAECEECLSTQIILPDQILQNSSLLRRECARRSWLRHRRPDKFHPTCRILGERSFFINKPLAKMGDDRLHALAVMETVSLARQIKQIAFNQRGSEMVRLKPFSLLCSLHDPSSKVAEYADIDSHST